MNWQNDTVLITGATGFVGQCLVKELLKKDANVKVFIKDNANILADFENQITIIDGNIIDPNSLKSTMDDIDVVFHLAAITNVNYALSRPKETFEINITGTLNLLEEARQKPVEKFIYISSSHIYGIPQYLPMGENHPINPREPYAASKAAAEILVNTYALNYGLKSTIIRPFNLYGIGQSEDFIIPTIIRQAYENEIIELGNITPTRDFLYISDAINGILCIAESGEGIYNLGSGSETSIKEIVETVINIISPNKKFVSMNSRKRSNSIDIPRMCADVSKLKKLNWLPKVSLKDGLMKTIDIIGKKWG